MVMGEMARARCQGSSGHVPELHPVFRQEFLLLSASEVAPGRQQVCAIRGVLVSVTSGLGVGGVIFSNCILDLES